MFLTRQSGRGPDSSLKRLSIFIYIHVCLVLGTVTHDHLCFQRSRLNLLGAVLLPERPPSSRCCASFMNAPERTSLPGLSKCALRLPGTVTFAGTGFQLKNVATTMSNRMAGTVHVNAHLTHAQCSNVQRSTKNSVPSYFSAIPACSLPPPTVNLCKPPSFFGAH